MNCDILPYLRAGDPSRILFHGETRGVVWPPSEKRMVWRFNVGKIRQVARIWSTLHPRDLPMVALDNRAYEYCTRALLSVAATAYLQGKVTPL